MKISEHFSQRKVMILALGLILTLFTLSWLVSGGRTNAQSDDASQPQIALAATGAGFTYQGQLNLSGAPANGSFTFRFVLYDLATGGTQIGSAQTKTIAVSKGLFTTTLNEGGEFGASAFNGEARYLEIRVSSNGGTSYTTLSPRQPLTAAPLAHSLRPGAVINSAVAGGAILNLYNNGANGVGLYVGQASNEGVTVGSANNGVYVASATVHGLVVGSAANGVYVQSASEDGVHVESATGDGLEVSAAANGVNVTQATQDGLFVCATGANTTCNPNDSIHSGVEIGNAEHYGLWVTDTGSDGVFIVNAGDDGMQIVAAGDDGLDITATDDGVRVRTVGGDGLEVASAVDGVRIISASGAGQESDGLQVESATGAGVRVDTANTGLYVASASNIGVTVGSALTGVYVLGPVTDWAGYFTGNVNITGACTGCLVAIFGVNNGDSPLEPGDVVALQGTRTGESVGQPLLLEVGSAQAGAPVVGVVYGRGELTNMEGLDGQQTAQLAPHEGVAQPGDYVHIVIYGPMQVKASALGSAIEMGDKLSVNNSGAARSLQTRVLDGMTIAESAPTIGIALESLATDKDGLIWVLVNPQ